MEHQHGANDTVVLDRGGSESAIRFGGDILSQTSEAGLDAMRNMLTGAMKAVGTTVAQLTGDNFTGAAATGVAKTNTIARV